MVIFCRISIGIAMQRNNTPRMEVLQFLRMRVFIVIGFYDTGYGIRDEGCGILGLGFGIGENFLVVDSFAFLVAEVDLDFVDLFEDLFGVGFDVGADEVDVGLVFGFVVVEVLFEVGELDVDLGNPDFHVNPDGDYGYQECKEANGLGKRHSEDHVFGLHGVLI